MESVPLQVDGALSVQCYLQALITCFEGLCKKQAAVGRHQAGSGKAHTQTLHRSDCDADMTGFYRHHHAVICTPKPDELPCPALPGSYYLASDDAQHAACSDLQRLRPETPTALQAGEVLANTLL